MSRAFAHTTMEKPPKLHVIDTGKRVRKEKSLETGVIQTAPIDVDGFSVLLEHGGVITAVRAAGCLLAPAPGDTVLVLEQPSGEHFVLNVLIKKEQEWTVSTPGDLCIESQRGACSLRGREVAISGAQKLSLSGHDVEVAGVQGRVRFAAVNAVFRNVETVAQRLVQKLGRCLRRVDYEQTKAGHVRIQAEEQCSIKARHASLQAEKDVFIDGERILLS